MHLPVLSRLLATTLIVFLPLVQCAPPPQDVDLVPNGTPARGVNLGNALEAPTEGEWGMVIEQEYFGLIAEAGFNLVRIPIRWSAHALEDPPYTIEPGFFQRVDAVIEQALEQDLITLINVHHFDALYTYPPNHEARFLAIWRQIAERYQDYDQRLFFELLNEPHAGLDAPRWNALAVRAIATVRESNPDRQLVLGPSEWNSLYHLATFELPADDHLIVTFHYYEPFQFTHQGAEWVEGSNQWLGTTWEGTEMEQRLLREDLDMAVAIAEQRGWTLFLGEFGAYSRADMASRVRWTRFLREEAEARGIAWAYWEFGAGFGVYDRDTGAWREELLEALVGE